MIDLDEPLAGVRSRLGHPTDEVLLWVVLSPLAALIFWATCRPNSDAAIVAFVGYVAFLGALACLVLLLVAIAATRHVIERVREFRHRSPYDGGVSDPWIDGPE